MSNDETVSVRYMELRKGPGRNPNSLQSERLVRIRAVKKLAQASGSKRAIRRAWWPSWRKGAQRCVFRRVRNVCPD